MRISFLYFLTLISIVLVGCEANNDRVPKREQGQVQSVMTGTIISKRNVTIQPRDAGRYGAVAGGVAGVAAGQTIGTTTNGRLASGLIGGVVGAYAGNEIDRGLNTQQGYEFIVQLDGSTGSPSAAQRQGEVISIVQTTSTPLVVGDKVYLLMGAGQTRIAKR